MNRIQGAKALADRSLDTALLLTAPQPNQRVVCSRFDAENPVMAQIV